MRRGVNAVIVKAHISYSGQVLVWAWRKEDRKGGYVIRQGVKTKGNIETAK
jgi:hypothetical protein